MQHSVNDLKTFYNSSVGGRVARVLNAEIHKIWNDFAGKRVLGCGYTSPYLQRINEESQFCCSIMFAGQGASYWPDEGKNRTTLSADWCLPFETNFFDHVLMVHALEYTTFSTSFMREVWRVLKGQGTALIIVPNRLGYWAQADWTPFGQGTPYTAGQLRKLLHEGLFLPELSKGALYALPFKSNFFSKTERLFETCGPYIIPPFGGVHVFEATKQLYVGVTPQGRKGLAGRGEASLVTKPAFSLE